MVSTPSDDGDDADVAIKVATKRHLMPELIRRVGNDMCDEHHVPDSFRDAIVARVLEAEIELGPSENLLSDEDWAFIRSAELRLLFLVAIKSSLPLDDCFNFAARNECGFVSPLLKKAQMINGGKV